MNSSSMSTYTPLLRPSGPLNLQDFTSESQASPSWASNDLPIGDAEGPFLTSADFNISLQDPPLLSAAPILGASTDLSGPTKVVGVRVQFLMTRKSTHHYQGRDTERMVVVGSLPQLTNWGVGCKMLKANGTWQYDMLLMGQSSASTVVEFLYKYVAVHVVTNDQIWESRISRCRLQLDKLLDHVFTTSPTPTPTPTPMPARTDSEERIAAKIKIVFQANGIPSSHPQTELVLAGSTKQLGNWDMKKAKVLKKAPLGTFHTTLFVEPGTSFLFSYFLVRNGGVMFMSSSCRAAVGRAALSPCMSEGAMLWTSGVGRVLPVESELDAVVQLLDEWEQFPNQLVPPVSRIVLPPPTLSKSGGREGLEELQRRLLCKVCWEVEVAMALLPCGHSSTCWRCGVLLNKCPICRAAIGQRIRVYI